MGVHLRRQVVIVNYVVCVIVLNIDHVDLGVTCGDLGLTLRGLLLLLRGLFLLLFYFVQDRLFVVLGESRIIFTFYLFINL